LLDVLREVFRDDFLEPLRDDLRDGTFAPFRRASFKPIAIACLRLRTLRPDPLFSVPRFLRRIVDSTFFDADRPYFAIGLSSCAPSSCKRRADERHLFSDWRRPTPSAWFSAGQHSSVCAARAVPFTSASGHSR
jgi:hypothetical protein